MKRKQVYLNAEGSEVLQQCRDKLEERDKMAWSDARVLHRALNGLKEDLDVIAKAQALQAKEKA